MCAARDSKKISEGKSRRFYYVPYPINQNQLKNQFFFVWFGHTEALRKPIFPALQELTHIYI